MSLIHSKLLPLGLVTYFLEVSAHALLKVATKVSYRGKKCENLAFLGYFSEAKTEEYNYSKLSFFFIILERFYLVQINKYDQRLRECFLVRSYVSSEICFENL